MIIKYELCYRYLGMNQLFWEKAEKALSWILEDKISADILEQIKHLVIEQQNVTGAVKECELLKQHVAVFSEENKDMVLAAVIGSILPQIIQRMSERNIPDKVIEDTLRDFSIWAYSFKKRTGNEGIWEPYWNLLFCAQRIIKIGRLQYEMHRYNAPYYIYKNIKSQQIMVLAKDSIAVRKDGRLQGTNGVKEHDSYDTVLKCQGNLLKANQVDAINGIILENPILIDLSEYTLLLAPGMQVLNIHIPETGALSQASVDESLQHARAFFMKLGFPCKVGVCYSWLMDPTLKEIVPKTSNIYQFMQRFLKFPISSEAPSGISRIFGVDSSKIDLERAPQETSLQRNLKKYLSSGGEIFDTGGILELDCISLSSESDS